MANGGGFFYGGGAFGAFLDQLGQAGFFSFVLPFLLIFALIFGIMERTSIFKEKLINGVIALSVALLSLQFDFVPIFFSQVFPRVGVGLAVLLTVIILLGLFVPRDRWVTPTLFAISAIVLVVVLLSSSNFVGSSIGFWFTSNWPWIVGVLFVLIALGIIVSSSKEKKPSFADTASPFLRDLFGIQGQGK